MIKRDITETVCEYDNEGKLIKKTVTETHEEEDNTAINYPSWSYLNGSVTLCRDTATSVSNSIEAETHCTCNCSNK